MPAVQREAWWRVLRGLALTLLLAVLLLHVAMPRVRVSPGDHLGPDNSLKQPRPSAKPCREEPGIAKPSREVLPDDGGEEGEAGPPPSAGRARTGPNTARPETE